ncbi:hypothetical protein C1645_828157 [Glomus cerebriforme]|uniref:Uncharacterized protein n=1 Tax=Glomus cerebriforme TaxID=658196 RepID=A0A397STA0_9GLOM|nr:hypothetical protein C1645_828157 [Glomus cerebriforme]
MSSHGNKKSVEKSFGVYTEEDDALLIELYKQYFGEMNKWKVIAAKLSRNHKSARERYVNHLDPTIDHSDLTIKEKHEIDELQTNPKYFKKWAEIAKKISVNREQGRRTELQVKNYWNSKFRSQRRSKKKSYERIHNIMKIDYIVN